MAPESSVVVIVRPSSLYCKESQLNRRSRRAVGSRRSPSDPTLSRRKLVLGAASAAGLYALNSLVSGCKTPAGASRVLGEGAASGPGGAAAFTAPEAWLEAFGSIAKVEHA